TLHTLTDWRKTESGLTELLSITLYVLRAGHRLSAENIAVTAASRKLEMFLTDLKPPFRKNYKKRVIKRLLSENGIFSRHRQVLITGICCLDREIITSLILSKWVIRFR